MGLYRAGNSIDVPFGDFAPDRSPDTPGILLDMSNAQPTVKGFQILNSPVAVVSGALTETPVGSALAYYSTAATQYWAGGASHLWRAFGNLWVQADSMGATPFNATKWNFAQFNDDLIAVGGTGVTPQVANGATGIFGALGGSPPAGAALVLSVNSQVMMFAGNTWYVSAIGSDNNWTPNIQTQAGSAPITDFPGPVIAAAQLYRNVIAFKNQAMWLGSYVGGASIWAFQIISDFTGTWGQGCVMLLPDGVAFLGSDDFYICNGYTPTRIPNSLKEWFFDVADPNNLQNTLSRYDPYHATGYWYFVSKNPPVANTPDRYVSYNFRAQRWGTGYLTVTSVPTPNVQPGAINGLYFDSNNILQGWTGLPASARFLTGYYGKPGKMSQLLRTRAKYNIFPTSEVLQPYHVQYLGQSDIAGSAPVKNPTDEWYNLRQSDRYHRVQLTMSGSTQPVQANTQIGAEVVGLAFEFRERGDR